MKAYRRSIILLVICKVCLKPFEAKHGHTRYCNNPCTGINYNQLRKEQKEMLEEAHKKVKEHLIKVQTRNVIDFVNNIVDVE